MKCVFCGQEFFATEMHSAAPYRGSCCKACNDKIVLPVRMMPLDYEMTAICYDYDRKVIERYKSKTYRMADVKSFIRSNNIKRDGEVNAYGTDFIVFVNDSKCKMKMNKLFNQMFSDRHAPVMSNVVLLINKHNFIE